MNNLYRFFLQHRVCIDSVALIITAVFLGALLTVCYLYLEHDNTCLEVRQEQIKEDVRRKAVFAAEVAAQNERIEFHKKVCRESPQMCRIMETAWRKR